MAFILHDLVGRKVIRQSVAAKQDINFYDTSAFVAVVTETLLV